MNHRAPESLPRPPLEPSALVRIGVLVNAGRRARRAYSPREVLAAAGSDTLVVDTSDVEQVAPAVARLIDSGANVIAVAGGDGTLHHALQGPAARGWPGAWLLLGGGTLNIVARGQGPASSVAAALSEARHRFRGQPFGALPVHRVPLLAVRHGAEAPRHGFVFGSEMVKNALEMYDLFGGGYGGLSRFLFEVARGYTLGSSLWRAEAWRLQPPSSPVVAETAARVETVTTYSAAIASTVDLAIGRGAIRAIVRPSSAPGEATPTFSARIIREQATGPLLGMIPALMRGGRHPGVVDVEAAIRLRLAGAYTLDGECFGRSPSPEALTVEAAGSVALLSRAGGVSSAR